MPKLSQPIELIQIETATKCNARCRICAKNLMKRKGGTMELSLFKKLIQQCKQLNIKTIVPFMNGDPMSDNRILELLIYIKNVYPEAEIGWYTNGSKLNEDNIHQLLNLGTIKVFNVSMQGGNKKIYEKEMGLSWDNTIKRINSLIKINDKLGNPVKIRINMVDYSATHDTINDLKSLWNGKNMEVAIVIFSNFGGKIQDKYGESVTANWPYQLCPRSQRHVYVLWDGRVTSCCFDINGENILGNANYQTLAEIWESDKMKKFRELHRLGLYSTIPVCMNCNANKFNG